MFLTLGMSTNELSSGMVSTFTPFPKVWRALISSELLSKNETLTFVPCARRPRSSALAQQLDRDIRFLGSTANPGLQSSCNITDSFFSFVFLTPPLVLSISPNTTHN